MVKETNPFKAMKTEIRRILNDFALDPAMTPEKAETEILNLFKSCIPTEEEIKAVCDAHEFVDDWLYGAMYMKTRILSKL